jgi:xylulokinase
MKGGRFDLNNTGQKKILTIDIGTTSVKTSIFNERLEMIANFNEEYVLNTKYGYIEFEAEKYWIMVKNGIERVCGNNGIDKMEISVIAITTQGETLIPVNIEGIPLRKAIIWLDGRASKESEFISRKYDKQSFYARTGIPECTGLCPVSKLLWIKNYEPDVYKNTYKFLLLEDFIILKFTGKFVTEKSLLTTTGYFDIVEDRIWDEILDYIQVNKEKLPEALECGMIVSTIKKDVARELGLNDKTVVVTAAMDQTAGAVGAGNLTPGIVTETTGTALAIAITTETPDFAHPSRVTLYRHIYKNKYLYIPICMTAGIILKWFKDEFCKDEIEQSKREKLSVYEVLDEIVKYVPPLSNGLVLLPYFTGVIQPDNNPKARGVFFGVDLGTKKIHFIRSIYESVAFLLRENTELIEQISGNSISEIRSLGGGSKSKIWLQIKADVTGKKIISMTENECTSLGVAIIGGVATGMFKNAEEASKSANTPKDYFEPNRDLFTKYQKGYFVYREIYKRLKTLYDFNLLSD